MDTDTRNYPTGAYTVNSEHVRGEGAYHWPMRWSGKEWCDVPGYEGHTFRQAVRHAHNNAAVLFAVVDAVINERIHHAHRWRIINALECGDLLIAEVGWWRSAWGAAS